MESGGGGEGGGGGRRDGPHRQKAGLRGLVRQALEGLFTKSAPLRFLSAEDLVSHFFLCPEIRASLRK